MAKMLVFVGIILGAFACSGNTGRNALKSVYASQIGVVEASGRNDGAAVEQYLKVTGLGKGNPWCAAFLAWCFEKAGIKACKSAYSPSWFPKSKIVYQRGAKQNGSVQAGDVFGIWFSTHNRIAHVGFVDHWGIKEVITVEGNTNTAGSRDGDGVYRKRRLTRQIYMVSNWIE